ncbi:hypothetical protein BAU15_11655 [Enterococcus sp. JM4C]|uniref:HI_0552 family protein n=1 Tax=Candidatus Enterococcus huntleyi TaxID=1857217 RepID=UPI00137AFDFD|nr:HI_0552 family protein [Enterococcus sp. JM4C]KAF1297396.1 hypothetical protein BAU15_11655 [Enterococcus sp. JM4C]
MELLPEDYQLFNRALFTFKQLKAECSEEEVEGIKETYKTHWRKWKELQLEVAKKLPEDYLMSKPKIESWTNGWNLRTHFWSAYRSENKKEANACLAALLNKKQYQVYLMFQHYKSQERVGTAEEYNRLLDSLKQWSEQVDITDYYIWPQQANELDDHLPLAVYLEDIEKQNELKNSLGDRTFQIGKLFFKRDKIEEIETLTVKALEELAPLYFMLE